MSWELLFAAETADRAAATLLHSLWQAALLAVAAAVVCRLGRLAVTAQYLVYATALALCAAALPLTYWMIEVDGRPVVAAAMKATADESREKATGASPVGAVSVEVRATAVRPPLRPRSQPAATGPTGRTASLAATWQRAIPWLLACYAGGVIGMLGRLALGVIGAERLRRAALPITDGPAMRALTAARRRWPLHPAPSVARSEQVVVPALVGLLKPTILLPVSATAGLTPLELELVLAHELAHVVRRDLWVTLFQRIVETVLFFNPAVWYLSRRTSTLREFCADEAACREASTRASTVRVDYATALLHMAELARPSLSGKPELLALAAAGRSPSEFRRRIARLLGEPVREPFQASLSGLALVALATVALAVGVVWAEPLRQPATPTSSKPDASRLETKPEDSGGATLKATIKSVQGEPLQNVYLTLWREAPLEQATASSTAAKSADLGFYHNAIWDDAATKTRWERDRSAHPNDGRHGRGEMNFHFDKLPAGKYRLTAVSYDSEAATPDPTPYAVSDVITLDNEGEKQVELTTLSGAVQLQLRVVDAETRQPISGVAIRLRGATDMPIVHGHGSGNFFERTDEAGGVRYGSLPAGSYSVEVLGKHAAVNDFVEYPPLADRVEAAVLDDHPVEIALPPRRLDEAEIKRRFPFSAFGVVTDDQGKPLQGVEVRAATGIATLLGGGTVQTDAEGRYRLYFGAGMHMEVSDWAPMGVGVQAAQFYATIDGWEMLEDRTEYNLLMSDRPREALAADRENSIEAWGVKDLDRVVYPSQPREINFRMKAKGRLDTESTGALSEKETLPGAPAPAHAPAPSSNTPEGPRSEAKSEDDSSAIQKLKVIVVDDAGQPIEGALVRQNHIHLPFGAPDDAKHYKIKNERYQTDAAGVATVTWEGKSVDLRIWASHPDRVPLHAMWAPQFQADGDKIPAEFRFELQPGTTIGGVVRDEAGKPVAGAKVVIVNHAAFTPAGSTLQPGKRPEAVPWLTEEDSALVTDAEGRWRATNIPSDEELNRPQHIKGLYVQDGKVIRLPEDANGMRIDPKFLGPPLRLQITHGKYAPYNGRRDWTLQGAPSLSELREGEAVVVLKPKVKTTENANGNVRRVGTESATAPSRPY